MQPYADTSREAMEVWPSLLRNKTAGEKLAMVWEMNRFAPQIAAIGVRMRYPEASDREVFLRRAALHFSREDMIQVYQWDPEEHGY
jgi:hypothetical protein